MDRTHRFLGGQVGAALMTAVAPVTWGTTYLVTTEMLPKDRLMTSAVVRALPAGLLLLALTRVCPVRPWWGKLVALSVLNIGAFFPLLFLAAYRLPGGVAAVAAAMQPLIVAAFVWAGFRERTSPARLGWAVLACVGVAMIVLTPGARLDPLGIAAAVTATTFISIGLALSRRWGHPPGMGVLASTGWQLVIAGVLLAPLVVLDHGSFDLDAPAAMGYVWLTVFATALAYTLWFHGVRLLPVSQVSLLVILSPITAAALGWLLLDESLEPLQLTGFLLALAGTLAGQRPSRGDTPTSWP